MIEENKSTIDHFHSFVEDVFNTIGMSVYQISVLRLSKISNKLRPLQIALPDSFLQF